MDNYLKEFVEKYCAFVEQVQRGLILSKKKSTLDNDTFSTLHNDLQLLEKACGLVGFEQTKTMSVALTELLIKLNKRSLVLDDKVIAVSAQATDFIIKTLKGIDSDDKEPKLEGFEDILSSLSEVSQPITESPTNSQEDIEESEQAELVEPGQQQEYIDDFLQEGYENIDEAESILLQLEQDPDNQQLIDSIFRIYHTIKGSCGIVGLPKTELLVHRSENLIGYLKNKVVTFSPEIGDILFKIIDALRVVFSELEKSQTEGNDDHQALIDSLDELIKQSGGTAKTTPKAAKKTVSKEKPPTSKKSPAKKQAKTKQKFPEVEADSEKKDLAPTTETPMPAEQSETVEKVAVSAEQPDVAEKVVVEAEKKQQTSEDNTAIDRFKSSTSSVSDKTIRIDIELLDSMMDQIGELVLNRNQIMQIASDENIMSLNSSSQGLNLITSELQAMIMQSRMQPIKHLWDKFPRMVRDLANNSGKKIKIVMEGSDTELDRSMLEEIRDPLMHLVRNAIDHGIELPEERVAQGKTAEGIIALKAFNEAGKVDIEISDDGKGINAEDIKKRALEKGLINLDQAEKLSEKESMELIFLSGLSTAEKVTNVSGRGVGMDVVKTNVEKIGGIISIDSRVGSGTTFSIKIPLTLVIIPVLLVTCGIDQYAIAQSNIVELVDLEGEQIKEEIELIHDVPVYRLRGDLLPLIFLAELLNLSTKPYQDYEVLSIVIIKIGTRQYGLVVDGIYDSQEIVIKPLSKQLKHLQCYSGATIIGDGKVALVLDVLGIIQQAKLISDEYIKESSHGSINALIEEDNKDQAAKAKNVQSLLLFKDLKDNPMAMPFDQASRLEEFSVDDIEYVGNQNVVQYRGEIMPLVFIPADGKIGNQTDQNSDTNEEEKIHVVVYTEGNKNIGMVVNNILDIVEEEIKVKGVSKDETVLFTTVLQGHVVEVLNVDKLIRLNLSTILKQPLPSEAMLEQV